MPTPRSLRQTSSRGRSAVPDPDATENGRARCGTYDARRWTVDSNEVEAMSEMGLGSGAVRFFDAAERAEGAGETAVRMRDRSSPAEVMTGTSAFLGCGAGGGGEGSGRE